MSLHETKNRHSSPSQPHFPSKLPLAMQGSIMARQGNGATATDLAPTWNDAESAGMSMSAGTRDSTPQTSPGGVSFKAPTASVHQAPHHQHAPAFQRSVEAVAWQQRHQQLQQVHQLQQHVMQQQQQQQQQEQQPRDSPEQPRYVTAATTAGVSRAPHMAPVPVSVSRVSTTQQDQPRTCPHVHAYQQQQSPAQRQPSSVLPTRQQHRQQHRQAMAFPSQQLPYSTAATPITSSTMADTATYQDPGSGMMVMMHQLARQSPQQHPAPEQGHTHTASAQHDEHQRHHLQQGPQQHQQAPAVPVPMPPSASSLRPGALRPGAPTEHIPSTPTVTDTGYCASSVPPQLVHMLYNPFVWMQPNAAEIARYLTEGDRAPRQQQQVPAPAPACATASRHGDGSQDVDDTGRDEPPEKRAKTQQDRGEWMCGSNVARSGSAATSLFVQQLTASVHSSLGPLPQLDSFIHHLGTALSSLKTICSRYEFTQFDQRPKVSELLLIASAIPYGQKDVSPTALLLRRVELTEVRKIDRERIEEARKVVDRLPSHLFLHAVIVGAVLAAKHARQRQGQIVSDALKRAIAKLDGDEAKVKAWLTTHHLDDLASFSLRFVPRSQTNQLHFSPPFSKSWLKLQSNTAFQPASSV
ncbi:hypothetical protein PTSG_10422 [Salpingoeca rosetta]|uniref:Uncharacterized protein n=1 Tax=Salpingoeca rosetta (strain ATCC 50818 / BSB-021) TaxID=946362 RepID=F2UPL8_SALR5|nr:uncharacterized protein PTSG_10422 [Salpingoeca rosetta]EGD79573.1 hypothetical protein PTSG_10422 [Salpingoeca rosetta]|eukprot:XP_004988801.1 hypothetical protein PTSG_10422 [Salpingoeca rosetta]